jgi:hypothetical protein
MSTISAGKRIEDKSPIQKFLHLAGSAIVPIGTSPEK